MNYYRSVSVQSLQCRELMKVARYLPSSNGNPVHGLPSRLETEARPRADVAGREKGRSPAAAR